MPHTNRNYLTFAAALSVLVGMLTTTVSAETDGDLPVASRSAPARIHVASENSLAIDIRDCLQLAVDSANAENLDQFLDCFTGPVKAKLRRQAAIRFVQHDVSMELVDSQILKVGRVTGEAVVRYRVALSDDRFDVVSLVALKQESGYWRIKSEQIQSYSHESPRLCSPSRYACLGGTCQIAAGR